MVKRFTRGLWGGWWPLFALFLLAGAAHPAHAASRWVGGCGPSANYATIQQAVNAALSGDEVVICPGTYTGNVTVANKTNLTIRSSTGVPADVAVFPSNSSSPTFLFSGSAGITLRDMSIHNDKFETVIAVMSGSSGTFQFQNLKINTAPNGNGTRGIYIDNNSPVTGQFTDIEIDKVQNGIIIDHQPPGNSSIQHSFNRVIVRAGGKGIQVSDKSQMSQVTVVATNTGIHCWPACLSLYISNSTVYSNNGIGIDVVHDQAIGYLVNISQTIIEAQREGVKLFRNKNYTKPNWRIENSRITSYTKQAILVENVTTSNSDGETLNLVFRNLELRSPMSTALDVSAKNNGGSIANICVPQAQQGIRLTGNTKYSVLNGIASSYFDTTSYGVYLNTPFILSVKNSCFMKRTFPRAYANTPGHVFQQNYWHGFTGTIYTDGNVKDNSPRTSCPVSPTSCVPTALSLDHYAITHGGSGWTCHPNQITISARDFNNALIAPSNTTTITVRTSTGKGDWTLVSGGGTFNNGTANDGIATYTFSGSESQVTLALNHTDIANVDITVTDNFGRTESPSYDPVLSIRKCATLLGYYKMEDNGWRRGDMSAVKDSSGNNRHGVVDGGPPLPSPTVAPGAARPGNPGTCGYGEFFGPWAGGGKIKIPTLPVDTRSGAKTSVSFWMYWDGTNNVMPLGWGVHDLWLINGYFGFNTGNSDVYGIDFPAASKANQWVHVAAVFTNGDVAANKLYINGVQQTLSQKLSSPDNTRSYVQSLLHLGGWGNTNQYNFHGRLDEVKVFDGELTPAEVTQLYNETHPCSTSWPELLAYYRMEDASWNGASGEVKDASGNNRHGQAIGSPLPTPNVTANPALSGNPGTCGYATFPGPWAYGGAVAATLPAVATDEGDKTSVSFWMYWRGKDNVMPVGWLRYDLWLYNNKFGFNTSCSDIYGISSAGLANGWHHVAAVFTNRNVKADKLYIDGVPQNLSQVISGGGPCLDYAYVGSDFRISGWANTSGYRFEGAIDEVKVFKGELTKDQVDQLRAERHACGAFHHLRVESPGPGYQCIRRPVTFKACADATCSTLYTGGVTFNLWNGDGAFYTVPTGGTPIPNTASGASVSIGASGSVTLYIEPSSNLGSFAIMSTPAIAPVPANGVQYYCPNYSSWACNLGMTSPLIGTWFPCPGKLNACDDYATSQCKSALSRLYTRLPAASSAFALAALDSSGNNPTILSGPLTVDLIATNNLTPTLDTNGCFTPDATSAPVTVTFSNQTHVPSATLNLPSGVWRNVRVRMTCPAATCPPSGLTRCSSDNFAIRPQALIPTFTSPNADSTGSSPNATPTYKAGSDPFGLQVTTTPAVSNYNGEVTIDNDSLEAHSGAPAPAGAIAPATLPSATGGSVSVTNLTYSEVGYFRFKAGAVRDTTWTQVDQPGGDCHTTGTNSYTNTPIGGKIGCYVANQSSSPYFGRFIPDNFALDTVGVLNHLCSTFNYIGQNPLTVATFKYQARNQANEITKNYHPPYAKLASASWSNFNFVTSPELPSAVGPTSGSITSATCFTGVCIFTAQFNFTRPTSPADLTSPYDYTFSFQAKPQNVDGGKTVAAASHQTIHSGNARLRYGRLVLSNAHGPEYANLTMPFETQYWTGTAWATNTLDSCTDITSSLVFVKNPSGMPSPTGRQVRDGKETLSFPAPNTPGTVQVCANIGADGDNPVSSCQSGTSHPWLQGSWDADELYNDNPSAVATFGRAQQQTPIIFRRERY